MRLHLEDTAGLSPLKRLQVSGSAPIRAAPGGTAATPEAVKQVVTVGGNVAAYFLRSLRYIQL